MLHTLLVSSFCLKKPRRLQKQQPRKQRRTSRRPRSSNSKQASQQIRSQCPTSVPLHAAVGCLAIQDSSAASTAASFNSIPSQGAEQAKKGKKPKEDDLQTMLQAFAAQRA